MSETEPNQKRTRQRRQSDQVRLESWKAIANFLNRSVRTVRRWEEAEGLPVRRHRHTRGSSVYAYKAELEEWQASHRDVLPGSSATGDRAAAMPSGAYAAALVLALLIGGVSGKFLSGDGVTSENVAVVPPALVTETLSWPENVAAVLVEPIYSAWQGGDVQQAFDESQRVSAHLPQLPEQIRRHLIVNLVAFSISLGRIDDALSLTEQLEDRDLRTELQVSISFASGDKVRMLELLSSGSTFKDSATGLYMSMAGLNAEAAALVSVVATPDRVTPRTDVIAAMAAMQAGDAVEAKKRFQMATNELTIDDEGYFFVALDMLSRMHKSDGDLANSIRVLETTMPQGDMALQNGSGIFWLMCQRQLASLYRLSGQEQQADKLEDVLRARLALADKSFPLANSLVGESA